MSRHIEGESPPPPGSGLGEGARAYSELRDQVAIDRINRSAERSPATWEGLEQDQIADMRASVQDRYGHINEHSKVSATETESVQRLAATCLTALRDSVGTNPELVRDLMTADSGSWSQASREMMRLALLDARVTRKLVQYPTSTVPTDTAEAIRDRLAEMIYAINDGHFGAGARAEYATAYARIAAQALGVMEQIAQGSSQPGQDRPGRLSLDGINKYKLQEVALTAPHPSVEPAPTEVSVWSPEYQAAPTPAAAVEPQPSAGPAPAEVPVWSPDYRPTPAAPAVAVEARAVEAPKYPPAKVEHIAAEVVHRVTRRYEELLIGQNTEHDKNTLDLMHYFPAVAGISIEGQTFYLSRVIADMRGGRDHCVGYTQLDNGQIAPRLFYKSTSEGEWRVARFFEPPSKEYPNGVFSKGETTKYGYARETRLVDPLREQLQALEDSSRQDLDAGQLDWVIGHFLLSKLGPLDSYEEEVSELRTRDVGKDIFKYNPGHGFPPLKGRPARETFASIQLPKRRSPQFAAGPWKSAQSHHPILGPVTTEVYKSGDDTYDWHFSYDRRGRTWVSGVTSAIHHRPSSYGTNPEVLTFGLIDNKPVEYRSQIDGLEAGTDYEEIPGVEGYVDITPLLANLPVIRQFKTSRGL